jgi:hypothetical protein
MNGGMNGMKAIVHTLRVGTATKARGSSWTGNASYKV